MPRLEELVGWGFGVKDVQVPDLSDGEPVNGDGPKMAPGKMLVLLDPRTGDQIQIRLSMEARDRLVAALTGVAIARDLPQRMH